MKRLQAKPAATVARTVAHGGIICNQDWLPVLEQNDLASFDALFQYTGGEVIKRIKSRTVTRVTLATGDRPLTCYLKRHPARPADRKGRDPAAGMLEFNHLCAFREKGLSTVTPVAGGQGTAGSLLLSADFFPFVALEDLVLETPDFFKGPRHDARRLALLEAIGRYARRMHAAGFNHRDYNATHILLHYEADSPLPEMAVFDLQRVGRRRFGRLRWVIKSLAEVNYTLPEDLFSPAERLHLLLAYKDRRRLSPWDRFQWAWIVRKTERIRRHTVKLMARRRKAGAIFP